MTALALPSVALYEAWAEAVAEFGGGPVLGMGGMPGGAPPGTDRSACERLVAKTRLYSDTTHPMPEGFVHSDYFWITSDEPAPHTVVGFIAVRHALNDFLLDQGGHIGYSVRPSRRREGHASRALGLGLLRVAELGIERALVTCDDDNAGSARTIESQGGVLEDIRRGNVATGSGSANLSTSPEVGARSARTPRWQTDPRISSDAWARRLVAPAVDDSQREISGSSATATKSSER